MTYPIADVIYGCPYPNGLTGSGGKAGQPFEDAVDTWLGEGDSLFGLGEKENSLWENSYSASPDGDPSGFFGIPLHTADGYWELKAEWLQAPVPEEIRTRVDAEWEKLPETIKELLGRPQLAIAWSDS